jgi:hypothetical protein
MAQIYTTHQGQPVAAASRGYRIVKAVTPDSTPKSAPPPNAGDLRRAARNKRRATLGERAREGGRKARTFARGG